MSRYFVTATGTDVGKTYIASALIRGWRAQGLSVGAYKPVVSGFDEHAPAGSDPAELLAALGQAVTAQSIDAITPYRFKAALSPDMAALREGRNIPYQPLMKQCQHWLEGPQDRILIEGAGGVMVPMDDQHLMRDWMKALGLPAIVVAGSYLGTISHTLTALETLAQANVPVAAVVISESEQSPVPVAETMDAMRRFAPTVTFAAMPRRLPADPQDEIALAKFIG